MVNMKKEWKQGEENTPANVTTLSWFTVRPVRSDQELNDFKNMYGTSEMHESW